MRESEERWKILCAQAAKEQDPKKLSELVHEINEFFAKKPRRLAERKTNEQAA